jgi:hypothetical protein
MPGTSVRFSFLAGSIEKKPVKSLDLVFSGKRFGIFPRLAPPIVVLGNAFQYRLRRVHQPSTARPHFSPHGGVAAVGEAADAMASEKCLEEERIGDSQLQDTAIRGESAMLFADLNRLGADLHRLDPQNSSNGTPMAVTRRRRQRRLRQ